jgi:hypothetical protein
MKKQAALPICMALWCASTWVLAQSPIVTGVYTCVDAKGRKLTSDRPIPECTDREQRVLNPSGTVKQTVGPTLTAQERAAVELKEKQALEERNRIAEERRRDKALLVRYPTKAMHDKERIEALGQIGAVKQAATVRLTELASQRGKLNDEMEFYKKDPTKAPLYLRRQVEDNAQSTAVQQRFIAEQDDEARRVNQRFDDELARLRVLWPTISK